MFVYLRRLNLILDFTGLKFLREEHFEDLNIVKKKKTINPSEKITPSKFHRNKLEKKLEVFAMKYV